MFNGQHGPVAKARQAALDRYYQGHPERFVHGQSEATLPPPAMHINPITSGDSDGVRSTAVNFPTLPSAAKALKQANRY